MKLSWHIWTQIRNVTAEELCGALVRNGWILDAARGAVRAYWQETTGKRVTIHYHPGKTYGERLLRALIDDIGWSEDDLKRLKLVK
jgi:predicted RNA binding protein YcfA (HicA-like mRNA interferase family)